jgi:hypothetical protein
MPTDYSAIRKRREDAGGQPRVGSERGTGIGRVYAAVVGAISLGALILSAGCSGRSQRTAQTAAPAGPQAASTPQLPAPPGTLAPGYPRPAEDTSRYDPEKEAEKIDIKLYPGARILSIPYAVRRGNYLQQRAFFTTTDGRGDVVKFYDQIYGVGTFQENAAGVASASIVQAGSRDSYLFNIHTAPDDETHIEVTEIRTCEMYPAPCDESRAPRPAEDMSGYDPEKEAEKIGVKLYPGAQIYSMPYAVQRGNYYQQRSFFATSDAHGDVVKFYDQIYGVGTFQQNSIGVAAASIVQAGTHEAHLFNIYPVPDGGTHIEVTALRPCAMRPAPCGGS